MKRFLNLVLTMALVVVLVCALGTMTAQAAAEWVTVPGVEGGRIMFDSETKAITDCETTVTVADLPAEIDGVAVTRIESYAFQDCSNLTSVTIPKKVTYIQNRAFEGCTSLAEILVEEGNSSYDLENGVLFDWTNSLVVYPAGKLGTSYTIPCDVTNISEGAFESCTMLTEILVEDGNPNYCSENGVLFDREKTTLLQYPAGKPDTSYAIPDGVIKIENTAFTHCAGLNRITIPASVTSIGGHTFDYCTGLTGVYISDIGAWCGINFTYWNSNPLELAHDLYLSGELVTDLAIPDGVTGIGSHTFKNCTNLTSVSIPDSVTSIGSYAFSGCSSLTGIAIPDSVTSIGLCAFSGCTGLTSVTIGNGVTVIGNWAFGDCSGLTSVTIPDSVTSIGSYAFSGCTGLMSITIPDSVTSIGEWAFKECAGLNSVTIGNNVTSIGSYAFENCDGLTSVTIPNSVTSIGEYAFMDCTDLTSVTIGNGVTSIEPCAFLDCTRLASVTIGNSVTSIERMAFRGCTRLTSINIPDSVTNIGNYAFLDCTCLTNFTIGNDVTGIEDGAFMGCTGLTSITIPDSVTTIGESAFYKCANLTDVYYAGNQTQWGAIQIALDNDALTSATIHYNSLGGGCVGSTEKLHWEYTKEDEIAFTTPIPENDYVMVAIYDDTGCFLGVKRITTQQLTANIGSAASFKLFWLDNILVPKCEAVTVTN